MSARHLQQAAALVSATTTGMRYDFAVTSEKADGSDRRTTLIHVTATRTALAWCFIGRAIARFMDSPHVRVVLSVELQRPAPRSRS